MQKNIGDDPRKTATTGGNGIGRRRSRRLRSRKTLSRLAAGGIGAAALVAGCAPCPTSSTSLTITTIEQFCGGVFNPDLPPCSSGPVSRAISVSMNGNAVASGVSNAQGLLTLTVPVGSLVVEASAAEPYMDCDAPTVVSTEGANIAVTQTCSIFAP